MTGVQTCALPIYNAKEFKEVSNLDADMQMFTEMLVRIGNLQQMQ